MIEKCLLAASEVSSEDVLNTTTVNNAVKQMGSLRVNRLVITDHNGIALFDSSPESQVGKYMMLPEVIQALDGYDVFSWNYHDGTMKSRAATPIMSYGTLVGCVYMMEHDDSQVIDQNTAEKHLLYIFIPGILCYDFCGFLLKLLY